MEHRRPFFPRYRTVRTVPWWYPALGPAGLALLIVWVMAAIYLLMFGVPELPR